MPQLIRALAPAWMSPRAAIPAAAHPIPLTARSVPSASDIESSAAFNRSTQCARLSIERRDDARPSQCGVPARVSVR